MENDFIKKARECKGILIPSGDNKVLKKGT